MISHLLYHLGRYVICKSTKPAGASDLFSRQLCGLYTNGDNVNRDRDRCRRMSSRGEIRTGGSTLLGSFAIELIYKLPIICTRCTALDVPRSTSVVSSRFIGDAYVPARAGELHQASAGRLGLAACHTHLTLIQRVSINFPLMISSPAKLLTDSRVLQW